MKRWILVLLAAMMTMLQTGAFAESDDEIIVFENVGIGALDLMTAEKVYDKATSECIGMIWE